MNAFEILEIEPTQDKKTIKKAYAALVKKYHPEEDMQKWQEIHEAYQSALEWADGRNYLTKTAAASGGILTDGTDEIFGTQIPQTIKETDALSGEMDAPEGADVEEQEEAELNNLFDNLEELSVASKAEKLEQEKRELQKALTALDQMERCHKLEYESWKELFSREEYQQAMRQSAFLYRWSEILKKRAIDKKLYQLMDGHLKSIAQNQESNEQTKEMVGLIDPIQLTEMRIRGAYDRHRETQKKRNKIAVFAILILIEVVPFSIYKINEWKEDRKWKMHMLNSLENPYDPGEEVKKVMFSEISLETMTETDMFLAGASWDGLAKFLMRADEEILSIVLPHTQTLESGVLVLGEEFEIEKALQGEKDEGETGNIENSYELVPLSLPFDNQIQIGEEIIDLPGKTVKFAIRTEGEADSILLWVDPKEMGFEEGCEIYYFNGEDYQKVGRIWDWDDIQAERHYYDVLTYQVFWVQVSRLGENEFPVTMVPIK